MPIQRQVGTSYHFRRCLNLRFNLSLDQYYGYWWLMISEVGSHIIHGRGIDLKCHKLSFVPFCSILISFLACPRYFFVQITLIHQNIVSNRILRSNISLIQVVLLVIALERIDEYGYNWPVPNQNCSHNELCTQILRRESSIYFLASTVP